ncbi:MAG: hypothetical protein ACREQL_06205 [Candidatus Binatia bacterium]
MSWLATPTPVRTLGDVLALRPDLLAAYRAFEAQAADASVLDPALRARYRRRIAMLVGGRADAPQPVPTARESVVVEFVEQVVLDPHGVTDELVDRLREHCPPREIVAIAQDVAVAEGLARLARMLEVEPEL